MRLTLRTLLAYLDNILEPNDAQDIGKKIEESEYASGLVHRIRDVMRRLRLGAPGLTESSSKNDPNTVAEYLDNTLASEEVTDFEKVCLESDVQLAEVGSCHQILTLVLGEPAEIDPESRQRMYQIGDARVSSGPPPTPAIATTSIMASEDASSDLDTVQDDDEFGERKSRPRPTVPEYLREPHKRRHWLPITAAVVLAVCFTAFLLLAMGQFEPQTPLGDALVQLGLREQPKPAEKGERGEGRGEKGEEIVKNVEGKKTERPVEPAKEVVSAPVVEPTKPPVEETPKKSVEATAEPPASELVVKSPAASNPSSPGKAENTAVAPTAEAIKESQKQPPGEPVATVESLPRPPKKNIEPSTVKSEEPAAEKSAAPLPPEPLGRLKSNQQVLLKDDPKGGWVRVGAKQMLMPQQLLVLPTYRAEVTLTVGVTLEILGGTRIELLPSSPTELPGIRILYGRVVLMPLAQPGSRLRVVFGNRSGVVTFSEPESVAAFDVRRLYVPGSNPEAGVPHMIADLYASAGDVLWDEIGGKEGKNTLRLTAPKKISFNAALTSEATAVKELPKWIEAEPIKPLDHRASLAIEESLPTDQPARLGLMELVSRQQKEVRWLALCCLGYLGQYRDMVAVLDDPAHKLDWVDYIVPLHEGIARDAESAAAIRLALEKQYPQKSPDLYRMLWGYNDDDLRGGADSDLVKSLDDDMLAIRVLSFWNLKELTGLGLFYRPELIAAKRQQPIARWKERLKAGEIRTKAPAEKVGPTAEEKGPPLLPAESNK